ncbi:MAG: outer membrane protein assembly factor BamA [Arcobacter sp.]|uniref:outer membrane protein assembly factor BamA n=1 Tax=Arcobacter sp. TaxID=1872629 RepID=UPI003AFFEDF0
MKKSALYTSLVLATFLHAQEIQSIKYVNLSKISQDIADETTELRVGDEINNKSINSAIKKFYKFGYFDDISVNNEDGNLEFIFIEKPSIANIEINNYKSRDEDKEALSSMMGIKKGNMYTTSKIKQAKEILLKNLEREGYVNSVVEVEIENLGQDAVAVTFNVNVGDEIIIKKVNYYGSDNLDAGDFEDVTVNNEKDFISWWFGQNSGEVNLEQLEIDGPRIRDQYFKQGYLDSVIKDPFLKINFASNDAVLDFFISEGQQYKTNDIKIYVDASIIDPESLYSELKLSKDDIFNIEKLREDQEFLKTKVADLGYAFNQVVYDIKKDEENGTADIVFNIIPGKKVYINDVIISGNHRTLDRVIRRDVYLAHGDLFSLTDFEDSRNKLKRTGYFDDVTIEQKRVSEETMDLIVKVKEAPTGTISLGGGYGSYDGLMISAGINEKNVFGSGLGVGVNIDFSEKNQNYSLSLTNPAIYDSKYNGTVEVHNREDEIDYSGTTDGAYELSKVSNGFSVSAGREIVRNLYAGAKYRFDMIEENYTDTDTSTNTPLLSTYNQDYITSSITPYINFNNTDDYMLPRNGIKAGTSLEYAGVGGDSKYMKSLTNFKYFHSLEDSIDSDWIFRYRANLNFLVDNGKLTRGDSLYMGGSKSLRGYESYAFGPDDSLRNKTVYKQMFTNSIELSFPLVPKSKMRWGVFYDYGMIGKDSMSEIQRSGTGALLEWVSPFGPLQFIFSQALDDEAGDKTSSFEFALGSSF